MATNDTTARFQQPDPLTLAKHGPRGREKAPSGAATDHAGAPPAEGSPGPQKGQQNASAKTMEKPTPPKVYAGREVRVLETCNEFVPGSGRCEFRKNQVVKELHHGREYIDHLLDSGIAKLVEGTEPPPVTAHPPTDIKPPPTIPVVTSGIGHDPANDED